MSSCQVDHVVERTHKGKRELRPREAAEVREPDPVQAIQ
jgi:hypothetical protein